MCTLLGAVIGSFYTKLQTVDADDIFILGGDWNCTIDFTQDRNSGY